MEHGPTGLVGATSFSLCERQGLNVICAPIPLTSLTNDITALNRALERTSGPVVLAGHAYAGAVIAGTTEKRVKSLVYVAALAPDHGETVAKVFYRDEPHPEAPKLSPGYAWLHMDGPRRVCRAVAHHASTDQTNIMGAVQRPIALACIQEPAPAPAWKTKPVMVLARGRGSHDQSEDAALHGRADGREGSVAPSGPHSDVLGAEPGDRRDLRGGSRNPVAIAPSPTD